MAMPSLVTVSPVAPSPVVTIVMALTAGIAFVLLVVAIRSALANGDLDAATVLVAAMALLISLPVAIVAFSGGISQRLDTLGNLVAIFPSWYHRGDQLAKVLIVAVALVLAIRQVVSGTARLHPGALLAVAVCGIAALASGLHGFRVISLSSGTLLACLVAATVLPRGRGASVGAAIAGVSLAIASGLLAVIRSDVALLPCTRKCSVVGSLLSGVLPNSNLLGITLAAAIPFVYLGFRGRPRYLLMFYLTWMAFATGTRTAMAAASVTVVLLVLLRPHLDGDRSMWPFSAVPWVAVIGVIGVWIYLVEHHWSSTALTDRGVLWNVAKSYIHHSPWFGYGPEKWSSLYKVSLIPASAQRSTHSQLLDLLFSTGIVGGCLFVAMLAFTVASARRARAGVLIALATMLMIGATEGTWQVGTFDFMSFSLVALLLSGEAARRPRSIDDPKGRSARPVATHTLPALEGKPRARATRLGGHGQPALPR